MEEYLWWAPNHGILTPTPYPLYLDPPPYTWYIDTPPMVFWSPTHGTSTPLSMVFLSPTNGISKPLHRVHEMCQSCQTWPAKFGQILLRTDTRLVFCNRKLMRTEIFFTRTTKPICNFANYAYPWYFDPLPISWLEMRGGGQNTIWHQSFLHSWTITGFVIRLTRRYH